MMMGGDNRAVVCTSHGVGLDMMGGKRNYEIAAIQHRLIYLVLLFESIILEVTGWMEVVRMFR